MGVGNLYLLAQLVPLIIVPRSTQQGLKRAAFGYTVLKFPVFYGLLLFLIPWLRLSPQAFMGGFSVSLAVMLLKVIGAQVKQVGL